MRIPGLAALILAILTVVVDIYIKNDIKQLSSTKNKKRNTLIYDATCAICWIFLAFILLVPKKDSETSVVTVMWCLFTYLSIYLSKFIYCVCSLIGRLIRYIGKSSRNFGVWPGIILALITCGVLWWGALVTRNEIDVRSVTVQSERLPAAFDGFTIMQFSDAHVGTWGNDTTFISNLVDSINSHNPDIILFTGDIVNRESSELRPFRSVLSRLHAPHGVYAVLGNHDYSAYMKWDSPVDSIRDIENLVSMMRGMGWNVLRNKSEFIHVGNDSIALIGVENWGEPPFNQSGDLAKAYPIPSDSVGNLFDSRFKILMSHNPMHWSAVVDSISNVDLTLSGHTHAMQTEIKVGNRKWSPAALRYNLWGGLYSGEAKDGTPMRLYVNIGNGEVGFPARLGAVPELTLIKLRK